MSAKPPYKYDIDLSLPDSVARGPSGIIALEKVSLKVSSTTALAPSVLVSLRKRLSAALSSGKMLRSASLSLVQSALPLDKSK